MSLRNAMYELLNHCKIEAKLSEAAYTSIRSKYYDQQYVWRCLLEEYNKAMASI